MFEKFLRSILGSSRPEGVFVGRAKTRDIAIQFRMQSGFQGDVNRTHPASIEPCLIDANAPPTIYGNGVLVDATTQGVRPLTVGDQALTAIYGVLVRPYPLQASSTTNNGATVIGPGAVPSAGIVDVLRSGYIMVPVVGTPVKGGAVYIWTAASSGSHVQGGFEAVNPAGSGMQVTNATWNGGPDSSGIAELAYNI